MQPNIFLIIRIKECISSLPFMPEQKQKKCISLFSAKLYKMLVHRLMGKKCMNLDKSIKVPWVLSHKSLQLDGTADTNRPAATTCFTYKLALAFYLVGNIIWEPRRMLNNFVVLSPLSFLPRLSATKIVMLKAAYRM